MEDIYFTVVFVAKGGKETVGLVGLYAGGINTNDFTQSHAEKVIILADDTLITINLVPGFNIITKSHEEVIHLIATAEEISFKLFMESGSVILEPTAEEIEKFVQVAKVIEEKEMLEYTQNTGFTDADLRMLAETYPITIEK